MCGTGLSLKPVKVSLSVSGGTDLERYEGMLVSFPQTLTVTEVFGLGRFGEVVLSSSGRLFQPNNGNGLGESTATNPQRRITLDDGRNAQNPSPIPCLSAAGPDGTRRVGDTTTGLTGVLSYGFSTYRIQPVGNVTFTNADPRPAAPESVGGSLKVASFNVLNYFTDLTGRFTPPGCTPALDRRGANNDAEFARQKSKIVAALRGLDADAVGLIEVQNNGPAAVSDLVSALNAQVGDGTYAAVADPATGVGCDAIKVAILYKPGKLEPLGDSQSAANDLFERRPVAQRFKSLANGASFSLVVNHFKSKG